MDFVRIWLIPPLTGAVIGYFTNWLAIKMLFRPLAPVYLGRLRLPFTPGILPRERERLTRSIAQTVSTEILTGDVFRSRLEEPGLQEKIAAAVRGILLELLQTDAARFMSALGATGPGSPEGGLGESGPAAAVAEPAGAGLFVPAGQALSASFDAVLASPEFRSALSAALGRAADEVSRLPLGVLLDPAKVGTLAAEFASGAGDKDRQALVDEFMDRLAGLDLSSGPLLPLKAGLPIVEIMVRSLYRSLLPFAGRILSSPAVREDLEEAGRGVVKGVIGRLGPLQRLIVSAANYEKTISDSMPDTIRDLSEALVRMLNDPASLEKVLESVREWVATPRIPPAEFTLASLLPVADIKASLGRLFEGLESSGSDFASALEARYRAFSDKSLAELLPGLSRAIVSSLSAGAESTGQQERTGERGTADAAAGVGIQLLALPERSPGKSSAALVLEAALSSFLRAWARGLEGKSFGEALHLGDAQVDALSRSLAAGVCRALSTHAERLVEALDIQTMVIDKVDTLDMLEVEKLVLNVAGKELYWITLLGGVLGAFIGILQSLISLL